MSNKDLKDGSTAGIIIVVSAFASPIFVFYAIYVLLIAFDLVSGVVVVYIASSVISLPVHRFSDLW